MSVSDTHLVARFELCELFLMFLAKVGLQLSYLLRHLFPLLLVVFGHRILHFLDLCLGKKKTFVKKRKAGFQTPF